MPFADDVRKYTFASLDHLVNKKGEVLTEHPYIPTEEQLDAMDSFVDAMDLMKAGEMDEAGYVRRSQLYTFSPWKFVHQLTYHLHPRKRGAWYDPSDSYNPSLHRVKQASFHSAVVSDLDTNPLPPPHPETLKYLQPPRRVLKRAADSIEACKSAFKVRQGTLYSILFSSNCRLFVDLPAHSTKTSRQNAQRRARPRTGRR